MIERTLAVFGGMVADRLIERVWAHLENENALPLPTRLYDVVVNDPGMSRRHDFVAVEAVTPKAAAVEAYRRAMRAEGFRCVHDHPPGDEVTLGVAPECCGYASVHRAGEHPAITYQEAVR